MHPDVQLCPVQCLLMLAVLDRSVCGGWGVGADRGWGRVGDSGTSVQLLTTAHTASREAGTYTRWVVVGMDGASRSAIIPHQHQSAPHPPPTPVQNRCAPIWACHGSDAASSSADPCTTCSSSMGRAEGVSTADPAHCCLWDLF